jgi:hypothetical protein
LADRFDVAARLAEGQPAVEHTQTYVQACHVLGYQHPDLTANGAQVQNWYEAETGLDLGVLDDDSAELRAAVNALDEALRLQRIQIAEIAVAWTGSGADSAIAFLQRHCDNAAQLAARMRAAAEGYAALRDDLWQLVDRKAATAIDIDDRRAVERSAWLAAAHMVTAGAGERSAAEEVVRQQIIPYVDNDIRDDWLAAMRSTSASVEAAYDKAVDTLSWVHDVCFEVPGELGPQWQPIFNDLLGPNRATATAPEASTPADIAPTVPAAVSTPPAPAPAAAPPPSAPPPPTAADLAAPLGDAAGLSTGAGDLGSLGGVGGGIGSVVGKIVDGIGGLLGSLADGFSDSSGSQDQLSDDALDVEDPLGDDDTNDDDTDNDKEIADPQAAAADGTDEDATVEAPGNPPAPSDSVDQPVADQVMPPPDAPPAESPPPPKPEPPSVGSTPCEIAADELPQAGQ